MITIAAMKRQLAPWGIALEKLRAGKKLSQNDLFQKGLITSGEYYRICRSKTGPVVQTLDNLIAGMGYTWHDWADAYEASPALTIHHPTNKTLKKNLKAVSNGQ